MGLTLDWLPSLRSLLSHRGVAVICLSGHVLSGMWMGLNGLQGRHQNAGAPNGWLYDVQRAAETHLYLVEGSLSIGMVAAAAV